MDPGGRRRSRGQGGFMYVHGGTPVPVHVHHDHGADWRHARNEPWGHATGAARRRSACSELDMQGLRLVLGYV